jgi:hypothetical protein
MARFRSSKTSPSSSPRGSLDSNLSSSSTLCSEKSERSPTRTTSSSSESSTRSTSLPTAAVPQSVRYNHAGVRPRRLSPPQTILGAIDEHSPIVQPDLQLLGPHQDHPVAKLHAYSAIVKSKRKTTLAGPSTPPEDVFRMVVGPNGESFADLRMNRKMEMATGWRKIICLR